ncbi:MAG: hypothetical protein ACRBN8_40010 [Nannocystales bacterium]
MMFALASVLAATAPDPDPTTVVDLQWDAPVECPKAAAVLAKIAGMTPPHVRSDSRPKLDATVVKHDEVFTLTMGLAWGDAEQRRELHAARCDSLVDAVAIEVALLLEAESEPKPNPEPEPEPSPDLGFEPRQRASPAPATTDHSEPPTPPPRVRWRVRAGILAGSGVAAETFAAPTLGATLLGTGFAVDVDVSHWPGGFVSVPGESNVGSQLSASSVTLDGCGRWGRNRFALAACGGVEIGALHARGVGLEGPRRTHEPLLAAVLLPRAELSLGPRFAVSVAPWLRVTLVRPGVRIDGVGEVFRAPRIGVGGAIRIEFEFSGRKPRPADMSEAR